MTGTADDLFAPPDAPWRRVSPALARMRRTVLAVSVGIVLVVALTVTLVFSFPLVWFGVLAVVLAALAGLTWVIVGRSARRWGYAELDEELYITRGAWFRGLVVVPYGRMQYVDVQAGPVDRAYGLARVHLHTAAPGTTAHIPGLTTAEAARLRDRLTALGEAQAAGL